ncbi:hypothetical protein GCM10027445_25840 [Amycolatopsis endophytica]|uniref:Putative NAD/FAD-dependent oxidoreductase n=1 Tax=Amycolatopsis endophytica TaxID=860233 RepID=A0A853BC46_9PSEU|nr:hypothetical protein [Amycolatopsis endophytica]NYI92324.1 putative NAD/FAD-dependent oxidoreductase [Amycolatopsis endophytica]
MSVVRIAVLGGGPGSLCAARLLELADPCREVTEQGSGLHQGHRLIGNRAAPIESPTTRS